MKKVFLFLFAVAITAVSYSQKKSFSYKLGVVTSIPADVDASTSIGLGSTLGEVSYPLSKKIDAVGTVGYTRYKDAEGKFSQIPVSVGARYQIDQLFHFGATVGLGFYNKSSLGNDVVYTPYVGLKMKKITCDIHYFNTIRTEPIKLIGLVFSYSL